MSKKQLILLVGATVILAIVAFIQNGTWFENKEVSLLFPELKDKLPQVTTLQIFKKAGEVGVTLTKNQGQWVVEEKYQYPADVKKINRWLWELAEATQLEAKTSRSELYTKLGVASLEKKTESERGVQVDIKGSDNTLIASILIGDYRTGANGGTFVRKPMEDKTWLVSGDLTLREDAKDWLDKQFIHVPPIRVQKVILTPPQGKPFTIVREKEGQEHFVIENLPKKVKLASETGHDVVASGLSHIYLEDVIPNESVNWEHPKVTRVEYRLFDGLKIQGRLAKINDKYHLALRTFVDPLPTVPQALVDDGITAQNAGQFKQKLESFTYVIPGYQAALMQKNLEDFIDKTPKEGKTASQKEPTTSPHPLEKNTEPKP